MSKKNAIPKTPAVRILLDNQVAFEPRFYTYQEHGGTAVAARELGVNEHQVVKTIVLETDDRSALIVLMHGDREISTKALARHLAVKSVRPCDPKTAERHTGYRVGGTSPLGTRKRLPVYVQRSILDLETLYLNGGQRGFLVRLCPQDLVTLVEPEVVDVAV